MVALVLSLGLVWGVGADDMVNVSSSTLRGVWVLFLFCSTILVCVSVVSSLVLGVILPWKMSASFLSESSFSVTMGTNEAAGARFFVALIRYVDSWVKDGNYPYSIATI